jgi:TfoX/Sxy family transcriptional regulator of competence genes
MPVNQEYLDFIIDQIELIQPFETKKMFGGIGFFKEGRMFAMIGGDKFRLKVDEKIKMILKKWG